MPEAIGWLVVQRNLTGSVQVAETPEVWVTAVLTAPSQHNVGMHAAGSADESLRGAVTMAATRPARGAPRQRPAVVLAPAKLVAPVREAVLDAGIVAGIDQVVTPDWAEAVLTELSAHVAGRR